MGAFNEEMESCDTRVVRDGSRPAMVVGCARVSVNIFAGCRLISGGLAGVFATERDFLRCRASQPASPYFVYTFFTDWTL